MSVIVKETNNMDLTDEIKNNDSVYLRSGRSNNIIVDNKVFIHDVRVMHNNNGDVEFISYNKEDGSDRQSLTVYNVESVIVESVYWAKKLFIDE